MSLLGRAAAAVSLRVVTGLPAGTVGRARVSGRLAPLLELLFAAVGSPLTGREVAVAAGPAAGVKLVGERRSLAWLSGRVEPDVQSILERERVSGGVFVDAGASIGFFSLLAARIVGPTGRVVAFEPQPAAASSIRGNAALNSFEQVMVVEAALGAEPGTAVLRGVGTATAHIEEGDARDGLRVSCVSLDDFLAAHAGLVPDLVKIDVEGHEGDVLAGMRTTLAEHRPVLVIELHGAPGEIVDALEAAEYDVAVVGSGEGARHASPASHLFAARRASADRVG